MGWYSINSSMEQSLRDKSRRLLNAFCVLEIATIFLFLIRLPLDETLVSIAHFSLILYFAYVHYHLYHQRVSYALITLIIGFTLFVTAMLWLKGGVVDEAMFAVPVLMLLCGILANKRLLIILLVYMVVNVLLIGVANEYGWHSNVSPVSKLQSAILVSVLLFLVAGIVWIVTSDVDNLLHDLEHENTLVKESEKKIYQMANHDQLTGLFNRQYAKEYFDRLIASQTDSEQGVLLIFLDLDDFKSINDSFGHSAGDNLLQQIAQRLLTTVGDVGIVCRQGGDEFLIVVDQTKVHQAVNVMAEKIRRDVSKTVYVEDLMIINTVSMGIAIAPQDGLDFEELSKKADIALYQAKSTGRNSYAVYQPEMSQNFEGNVKVLSELRYAVANQELELYYQPKVNLSTGKVFGVEALVRWNHPEQGLLYPDHFIHIAEASDVIYELGNWVLNSACQQCKQWIDQGFENFSMAVNVSSMQFRREDFVTNVKKMLEVYELPKGAVILEITESTLLDSSGLLQQALTDLADSGVELSIDDFGTGYSNLGYLKKMSVSSVKIDKSFVMHLLNDSQDRAIVKTIIEMGNTLNFAIVAEGIENEDTAQTLADMGCQQGQGYFWTKALPVDECTAFMREYV